MTFISRKVGNKVVYGWVGWNVREYVWKLGPFVTEEK